MTITFYILSAILIALSLLPLVRHQHWMFRVWDFGRIQFFVLQIITTALGWLFVKDFTWVFYSLQALLLLVIIHNVWLLLPYTPIYKVKKRVISGKASNTISVLSANVYQFNTEYHLLLDLIDNVKPDIVFTVESNSDWENELATIEKDYPHTHKQALENTYGMHFYSKIPIERARTHYFVSDDLPSFEITLKTEKDEQFTIFGVHPPPPSPSEEDTSKERDGDLMAVAKRVKEMNESVLVVGDFNNVAWARSSQLFRKTSSLIDPRRGYGLVSTFHATYKLLRVPIDLLFHSSHIFMEEFKTLSSIGSDHFPMYCSFYIDLKNHDQEKEIEAEKSGDSEEADELIEEGKKTNGDRDAVASE